MRSVSCPVCGQRGRTDDLNHFEPRGTWKRKAAVMCSVCGSGLSVGRGPFGPRARLIDPEQWARMRREGEAAVGAVQATGAGASGHGGESSEPVDAGAGLEALGNEIVGALEAMRRLPAEVDDARFRVVYEQLMTALVWTKDLLMETRAASSGGAPPA